ncbi:MAG: HPr family phosphocarrier protein [Eubacteriales bacterium]|nr:HPr family phosphocarrier protein [Eubacteriales bacterium]
MQQRKCRLSFIPDTDLAFVSGFVMKASQFKSDIKICYGDSTANAKSILGMIHAAIVPADEFILQADGVDETEAVETLSAYLADPPERNG